jgi:hypothetical protein
MDISRKKSKLSSVNRLPSLFVQTLAKSEYEYQREIRRKLEQIDNDNRDTIRRRQKNSYLFAHEHLSKRYQWFHYDKTYRDSCRNMWSRDVNGNKTRADHVHLPDVFSSNETSTSIASNQYDENPMVADARIKQNFLHTQPVMLEIMHAPHASKVLKTKQNMELRKRSAQRHFRQIQSHATDDQRYQQLVGTLQET